MLFSYEGHNVIPKQLSHSCDNEIKQSNKNEPNVWKRAKSVGEKKEKGASPVTWYPGAHLPPTCPVPTAQPHTHIVCNWTSTNMTIKKHMDWKWRRRAENYWRCFLQRGETRMNQITAKMRHLQCDAVSKATVMFLSWFFAFFVIFVFCCFIEIQNHLWAGGGRLSDEDSKRIKWNHHHHPYIWST